MVPDGNATLIVDTLWPLVQQTTLAIPRGRYAGYKRSSMTLRYAHVGDRETEAAAERIGAAIARTLDDGGAWNGR